MSVMSYIHAWDFDPNNIQRSDSQTSTSTVTATIITYPISPTWANHTSRSADVLLLIIARFASQKL